MVCEKSESQTQAYDGPDRKRFQRMERRRKNSRIAPAHFKWWAVIVPGGRALLQSCLFRSGCTCHRRFDRGDCACYYWVYLCYSCSFAEEERCNPTPNSSPFGEGRNTELRRCLVKTMAIFTD